MPLHIHHLVEAAVLGDERGEELPHSPFAASGKAAKAAAKAAVAPSRRLAQGAHRGALARRAEQQAARHQRGPGARARREIPPRPMAKEC